MPTKVQAKTAIDNATTAIKADIDNTLPTGINIVDGGITFNPTKWGLKMDAGGNAATAESWATAITTNLAVASRTFTLRRFGRRSDDNHGRIIAIDTILANYIITNF